MLERKRRMAASRAAFTLMEMLVVVAILVVLAGAAIPIYLRYLEDAKKDRARLDVKTLTDTAQSYYIKNGEYPASLEVLTQPQDGGPAYLEPTSLIDPWQRPYQYTPEGQHNQASGKPDIWSLGPRPNDPNGIIGNWTGVAGDQGL